MKYFIDTEFLEGTQEKRMFGFLHSTVWKLCLTVIIIGIMVLTFLHPSYWWMVPMVLMAYPVYFVKVKDHTKPTIDLISIGIVAEDGREYYAISKDFNLKEAWNRYDCNINIITKKEGPRTYWIRDNILKPIYIALLAKEGNGAPMATSKEVHQRWNEVFAEKLAETHFTYKNLKRLINKYGKTNKQIAEEVNNFSIIGSARNTLDGRNLLIPFMKKSDKVLITIKEYNCNYIYEALPIEFYGYYCDYDWVVFCWLFGKMIDLPKGFPMYCIDLKQEIDNIQNRLPNIYNLSTKEEPNNLKQHRNYPEQTNEHSAIGDARWNKKLYEFLNTL